MKLYWHWHYWMHVQLWLNFFQRFSNWWHSVCLDTGWGWTMQSWPKKNTLPCKLKENVWFVASMLRWKLSSNYIYEDYWINMCFTMVAILYFEMFDMRWFKYHFVAIIGTKSWPQDKAQHICLEVKFMITLSRPLDYTYIFVYCL